MKKKILIAGIIGLVLAALGLYYYDRPHADTAGRTVDIAVNAIDLYNQYQKDEAASNKKFLDKIIEVKGTVVEVQQAGNTISIQLDGGSSAGGVNCSIADHNKNNKSQLPLKGDAITIKGRCAGMLMDVSLVDCVIE